MFSSFFWFDVTFWLYFVTSILYILYMVFGIRPQKKGKKGNREYSIIGRLATIVGVLGGIANTLILVIRTIESNHAPYANLFESMVLLAWAIMLGYLILEFFYNIKIIGCFIVSMVFLTMLSASLLPYRYQTVDSLNPALQSNWLVIHVFVTFIGYAGFAIACGLSIIYLIKERFGKENKKNSYLSHFPEIDMLDELSYKSIALGFPFLTLGIITGAIWANYAWGGYWSWDPKETWSLIAWFIYAAYLHARMTRGWRGRKTAIFSIIGFLSVVFLYWGVSFILPGLHAYA
ncbi:MAG: c-type cytochrome biogenesis protein CcsB [Nitrospirota bacterium]